MAIKQDWLHDWRIWVQIGFVGMVAITSWLLWRNLTQNLAQSGLELDFTFLQNAASFDIPDPPIPYNASDTYSRALLIGGLNTLKVVGASLLLASSLGLTVGIARLSPNWLLKQMAAIYVEALRNTPLLVQLFFWYSAIFLTLPQLPQQVNLGMITLSNEGIMIPSLNITFASEFCALVLGLSLFSSAFIAEIVRGGILAIPKGQLEAGRSLGLSSRQLLWLVTLPQALRVIVPPLTSQYLNIAKNSSLAVAIGYRDIYAIASTSINQTGRPVNLILILMATYLTMSLIIAAVMGVIGHRVRLR